MNWTVVSGAYHWASQQRRQKGKRVIFSDQRILRIFLKRHVLALMEFITWVFISKAKVTVSGWNFVIAPFSNGHLSSCSLMKSKGKDIRFYLREIIPIVKIIYSACSLSSDWGPNKGTDNPPWWGTAVRFYRMVPSILQTLDVWAFPGLGHFMFRSSREGL